MLGWVRLGLLQGSLASDLQRTGQNLFDHPAPGCMTVHSQGSCSEAESQAEPAGQTNSCGKMSTCLLSIRSTFGCMCDSDLTFGFA